MTKTTSEEQAMIDQIAGDIASQYDVEAQVMRENWKSIVEHVFYALQERGYTICRPINQ
jgi:predicted GNAT superfamily acetyltransferase